ncbi:MAG: hypothetical protein COA79_06480 [Planctomycetota bacterium]|nr:MAG: hypothetical protein COA79_06480 [Planctomycetota bacterium]
MKAKKVPFKKRFKKSIARLGVILFLGQVLVLGLYIIHLERLKLKSGYEIGRLMNIKKEKQIQQDEEYYLVEKLKSPKMLLRKSAELNLNLKPANKEYYKNIYVNPEERMKTIKEFHENKGKVWKSLLSERDALNLIDN